MHPLTYKQLRQVLNALRRSVASPRQFLAFLIMVAYGIVSMGMIVVLILFPLPEIVTAILRRVGLSSDALSRLQELRGSLTLTLLLLTSTAIFQNPLLRFSAADADMLFATPIPIARVLIGRLVINHLRTFFAGYFFWGLAFVPILRLLQLPVMPDGLWALAGLMLLFASVDQAFAALALTLQRNDIALSQRRVSLMLILTRGMLLLFASVLLLVGAVLVARLASGTWDLLVTLMRLVGGPITTLVFPLGWATDLLFRSANSQAPLLYAILPLFGLVLVDLLAAVAFVRLVQRNGAGLLTEVALSPVGSGSRLGQLVERVGWNPLRLLRALWQGDEDAAVDIDPAMRQRSLNFPTLYADRTHIWRRLTEMWRTPWRNVIALSVLGVVPLALYNPFLPYSLPRVITAIIFSTSLSTQMFNDIADHLLYANLELSAPLPRWRILFAAYLPRLVLYWVGGLFMLLGIAVLSPSARLDDLFFLALWYPLVLIPLLALRSALVFIYPAAGVPSQRDPVQAMLVMLVNGLLVMLVIGVSLLPFGVLLLLMNAFALSRGILWGVVFSCSLMLAFVCTFLAIAAYQRYEPGEGGG